jgi:WD40 repeat protein
VDPESDTLGLPPPSTGTATDSGETVALGTSATPPTDELVVPPEVAGYELFGEVGRGGMGVVYKARQFSLNRVVALKMVLAGGHANPIDLVRFLAEAEAAAQLQHPHIVQVHAIGKHAGLPFLSLEFVDGGTLANKLNGEPQQPRAAAGMIETLARAVHHAHEHGIIHRDLKPANVLLTADGAPKIADFGLAKRGALGTGMTQTGAILGTPSYMAPEQAEGKKDVGPAADTYALGAILYEMLTGRPPFKAPTPLDTIMQVVGDEPVPPRRLQPKVPRDLETICLKCLQKEPKKRYASALALADDLARFRQDQPIVARPVSRLERTWRWCRRNPVVASLLVLVAVGIVAAGLLLNNERTQTLRQLGLTQKAERERTEQLATSYLEQARARRYSRQPGQRFQSLAALAEAAGIVRGMDLTPEEREARLGELRNEAVACLALIDVRQERRLADVYIDIHGTGYQHAVAFTPAWDAYARAEPDGPISVRRVDDEQEIIRLPGSGAPAYIVVFSPDGRYLLAKYYQGERPIEHVVWEWKTGRKVLAQPSGSAQSATIEFAFTPDSRHVLLGSRRDGSLGDYDLTTGQEVRRLDTGGQGPWVVALHPDGRRLATTYNQEVTIRDVQTGAALGEPWQLPSKPWSLAWQPGTDMLAAGCENGGRIFLWDAATRQSRGVLEGHESTVVKLAFNPAGTLLASYGWDYTTRLWDPATGKELLRVPSDFVEFSPDGRRLAYVQGKDLGVWEVADRADVCRVLANRSVVLNTRFALDDRVLAVAGTDGVSLWDVRQGKQLAVLPVGHSVVALPHPSDESLIVVTRFGVSRWPLRRDPDGAWHVGPARPLQLPIAREIDSGALDAAGHKLVVSDFRNKVLVTDLDAGSVSLTLNAHPLVNRADLSPDGRWVVTTTFKGADVKVWDLAAPDQQRQAASFRTGERASAGFSQDGRWLVVNEPVQLVRYFYRVGTWELARQERIAALDMAGMASTPEGMMALAAQGGRECRLLDPGTGRVWATLPALQGQVLSAFSFSRDGGQLAVAEGRSLQVWDLRALRRHLGAIGLDWETDAYPPAPDVPPEPPELTVEGQQRSGPALDIVALPPPRPRRQAKPEEIAGWVGQLSDKDDKTRSAAAQALEEVGPAALEALDEAAKHPDAAVRRRVREVLDRIEVAQALTPRRVNLKVGNADLADTVKALAKETGLRLTYTPKPPAEGSPAKTVTLQLEEAPPLEAVDRLCQAAGLVVSPAGSNRWNLVEGKPPPREVLAYSGPVRVQAGSLEYLRRVDLQDKERPDEKLRLQLLVSSEAATEILGYAQPRVVEARDDGGRSLLPDAPLLPVPYPDLFPSARYFAPTLLLRPPPARGGTLQQLKLLLPVEVKAHQHDLVTATDFASAAGKTFRGGDGLSLKVQSVQMLGSDSAYVQFAVTASQDRTVDPKKLRLRLTDAKGAEHPALYCNINPGSGTVRVLESEDLLWLAGSPSSDFPAPLPWAALATKPSRSTRRQWVGTTQFVLADGVGAPAKLTLFGFDRLRTELPIEFHDLPLP